MIKIKHPEKTREVIFTSGYSKTFHNVKWFDNSGNWLRIGCNEGYVLLNPDKILCIIVPEKSKVR